MPALATVTQMFTDQNIFQTLRYCMHKCESFHVVQCLIRRIFLSRFRWKDFLCLSSWNICEAINSNTYCLNSSTNVCKPAVIAKTICHSLWHLLQELSHFVCFNEKDWIRWGCRSWRLERRSDLSFIADSRIAATTEFANATVLVLQTFAVSRNLFNWIYYQLKLNFWVSSKNRPVHKKVWNRPIKRFDCARSLYSNDKPKWNDS